MAKTPTLGPSERLTIYPWERLCPDCKGEKWFWNDEDWPEHCDTCGGQGKISKERKTNERC